MARIRRFPMVWLAALGLVAIFAFWLGTRHGQTQAQSASSPTIEQAPRGIQDAPRHPQDARAAEDMRSSRGARNVGESGTVALASLPSEARDMVALIQRGGPYAYPKDGTVFGNRERLLPAQPRGYYHEYTVARPGARNRGTRRIITGGTPPEHWYYTDDHYQTFVEFTP